MKGRLTPIMPPANGEWVSPEVAAKLAKNGRGITIKRMMDKIYAGELNGYVKKDYLGWWVFVPYRSIQQTEPLKAA
jgi:hypothetical protein